MFKKILLLPLLILSLVTFGQESFEGEIDFSIRYSNLPQEMAGMESMLPVEMNMHLKGAKSRTEQKSPITGSQIVIANMETNYMVTLMDILGNKIAMASPMDDMEAMKVEAQKIDIEYLNETKTIAGYKCKKALIKSPDLPTPIVVYYTDKFTGGTEQFGTLKGFALEYSVTAEGVQMNFTATRIEEGPVDDSLFIAPEEYKIVTQEELQNMYGG
jgi:GLPGLI family protein